MLEDKNSNDFPFHILIGVALIIGSFFVGIIVLALFPIYKFFKENKFLTYYGVFLFLLGLVCLYKPFTEYIFSGILNAIYALITSHLNYKFTSMTIDLVKKGFIFQIDALPLAFILGGAFSFIKGYTAKEKKTEKITVGSKNKVSLPQLKSDYKNHLEYGKNNEIFLGRDRRNLEKCIIKEREGHMLCVGATRTGKTSRVLVPTILSDFFQGNAVLNIDPKGSLDTLLQIYKVIKYHGKEDKFKLIVLDKPEISTPYIYSCQSLL